MDGVVDFYDSVRCLAGQLSNLEALLDANCWFVDVMAG